MGKSRFEAQVFNPLDRTWWASWGGPSWTGPREQLVKKFPEFREPTFESRGQTYGVEYIRENIAVIKPLGHAAITDEQ